MPNTRVLKIAASVLPIIDEITTSDLQGIIGAEVSMLGLHGHEAMDLESAVLEYVYQSQEKPGGDQLLNFLCSHCRGAGIINGQICGWCVRQRIARGSPADRPKIAFVAVHQNVMRGQDCIARACSKTMAKRIARALNNHVPNREGV